MSAQKIYDVVIIGGSYAGLSAALALGRSLRHVLVIDNNNPCNKSAPEAHNFLTNDGATPCEIRDKGKAQIKHYKTVVFANDTVTDVVKTENNHFKILSENSKPVKCKKVLFATGITDTLPNISGFKACWGISILHCPYCHGYEVANKKLGVLGNADMGYEMAKTICHWADELILFTNGVSTLSSAEVLLLNKHNITLIENEITNIVHDNGYIQEIQFEDTEPEKMDALFTQLPFVQQCDIPEKLGCEFTDNGFIKVSKTMETSIPGIYAAGDCLTLFRSVANAVAAGNKAGATINKQFIAEAFELPEVKIIE